MREISGKVVLEGSGDGLTDLAVVAFDVGEQATALFVNGGLEGKPEAQLADHELRRLGSVLTGRRGEFRLNYEDQERGPNLGIVLVAPATDGERCGRIIGTSCGVRQAAAAVEAFTFVVPKRALTPASLGAIKGKPEDPAEGLARLRGIWQEHRGEAPKLSDAFRAKRAALEKRLSEGRAPDRGFRLALSRLAGSEGSSQEPLTFDRDRGRWELGTGTERVELTFEGVAARGFAAPGIEVDREKRVFRLVVGQAEASLTEAAADPGPLMTAALKAGAANGAVPMPTRRDGQGRRKLNAAGRKSTTA
jgi:hypothetical protein